MSNATILSAVSGQTFTHTENGRASISSMRFRAPPGLYYIVVQAAPHEGVLFLDSSRQLLVQVEVSWRP